jgi:hypothetical protein
MGFQCGIVGLPNVGKSTLFNALTSTASAEAANYPFCTIEPNVGRVGVPDKRLDALAEIVKPQRVLPTQIECVDIAGLVKGASKGEGLGNQFLSHIREVDAIIHVLRCFDNDDITHVMGDVDPLRDAEIVETELILSDLESLEKRIQNLERKMKSNDKDAKEHLDILQRLKPILEEGLPARNLEVSEDEAPILKSMQFITTKPIMYVCNVDESDLPNGNAYSDAVKEAVKAQSSEAVIICSKIEEEIANLESDEEKKEFIESLGLEESGLNQIIRAGYALLNLTTFFTAGEKEVRAWTIRKNARAPQAAGAIHTDFERGFIRSETIAFDDFIQCKGEQGAKDAGKLRQEGKEYLVQDGDVMHFRFNV